MRGVNRAIIAGHLGKAPEVRYLTDGKAVASFSIATTEKWKDKSGQQQEKTEWHNITAFGRLGEIAGEYLKKGAAVYVEGKITTEKWTDREGKDRYTTKIIASEMQMLGGKGDGSRTEAPQRDAGKQPPSDSFGEFEDDIPFMRKSHLEGG